MRLTVTHQVSKIVPETVENDDALVTAYLAEVDAPSSDVVEANQEA